MDMVITLNSNPAKDGYRMPAEFEPHDGCWMIGPNGQLANGGKPAEEPMAVAEASRFEPETMGVRGQFVNARCKLPGHMGQLNI